MARMLAFVDLRGTVIRKYESLHSSAIKVLANSQSWPGVAAARHPGNLATR